ncbi:MAG: GWxTD domain-containing protein [candidate division KSB1 bacterium]|nr:GWxTD domain-containing protein [candidate division KSB1 bacterium]MDZ7272568.1 GWxTD domain-containing protein [candidate division KSB1 bacterium]MDZ7284409.1 GWxTD domain-containing protein [candidate division KSB1 bacterium]MDZ7297195.1 GWxTD domain-containing protein [candidate division KSB1 bacterium]MDZ7348062.1 GWxTD domain-containing protein [candidate division KSB1 bacterium]
MKPRFALLACLLLAALPAAAQDLMPAIPFTFNLDYARFRNDAYSGYLEVYYSFQPRVLSFHFANGKYHAGVRITTRLRRQPDVRIVAEKRTLFTVSQADTAAAWYNHPMVTQAGFALPHGTYSLEVVAEDSLAPDRRDSVTSALEVSAYPSGVGLSDLELCRHITPSQKKEDLFFKNGMEVVPHPQMVFGTATTPVVFHYLELYNLDPSATYRVKTVLSDADGKPVREASKERVYRVKNSVEVGTSNVTNLPSGKYLFHLLLFDRRDSLLADTERAFFVYNPHLTPKPPVPATVATGESTDLAKLSQEALDEEFQQAAYLAKGEENKVFRSLTTLEAKREFLRRFWMDVEKGRGDTPAISRAEYLRRLKIVNQRFASLNKAGWRSHRGRVYLLYGEPSEIERFPSAGISKPHEIWRYHAIENGVEFIFIDRLGFNDYELVHSTKRGELRDENWEELLR